MTIRIHTPIPPIKAPDEIVKEVLGPLLDGQDLTAEQVWLITDARAPGAAGRLSEACLILARALIKEQRAPQAKPQPIAKTVERLSETHLQAVTNQILADAGVASEIAKSEKRPFGTRELRQIIERNLRGAP